MNWKMKSGRNWGQLGMEFKPLKFSEITVNYDKNRIPLSTMERDKRNLQIKVNRKNEKIYEEEKKHSKAGDA